MDTECVASFLVNKEIASFQFDTFGPAEQVKMPGLDLSIFELGSDGGDVTCAVPQVHALELLFDRLRTARHTEVPDGFSSQRFVALKGFTI